MQVKRTAIFFIQHPDEEPLLHQLIRMAINKGYWDFLTAQIIGQDQFNIDIGIISVYQQIYVPKQFQLEKPTRSFIQNHFVISYEHSQTKKYAC